MQQHRQKIRLGETGRSFVKIPVPAKIHSEINFFVAIEWFYIVFQAGHCAAHLKTGRIGKIGASGSQKTTAIRL